MAKAGKALVRTSSKVWRMSAAAPLGEWVDPSLDRAPPRAVPAADREPGAFTRSSFDLLDGIDVSEEQGVSEEVFAELFGDSAPGALSEH